MKAGILAVTLLVGLQGYAMTAAHAADTQTLGNAWSEEHVVSASGVNSSGGVGRKLVVDSQGRLHAVWTQISGNQYDLYYAYSDDNGQSWSTPEDIAPSNLPLTGPNIAVDADGFLHAAWNDRRNGATRIYYMRSVDRGDTWETPRDVSGNQGRDSSAPSLSIDSNRRVHIAWHIGNPDTDSDATEVYYVRSGNQGGEFGDPVRLSQGSGHAAWPRFTVEGASGQRVAVAWRDRRRNPDWDVYVAVSEDAGVSFQEHAAIATDDRDWDPEALVDASGTIHLTFTTFYVSGASPAISYARSLNGGQSWNTPVVLSEERSELSSWAVDASGRLWMWWKDLRDADPPPGTEKRADAVLRHSADGGANWSALEFATDQGDREVYFPSLAIGPDGRAHVYWSEERGDSGVKSVFHRSRAVLGNSGSGGSAGGEPQSGPPADGGASGGGGGLGHAGLLGLLTVMLCRLRRPLVVRDRRAPRTS